MTLKVAELETVFTADIKQFDKGAVAVETTRKGLANKKTELKVTADERGAVQGMDRVEEQAKRLVSKDFITRIDADISKGEARVKMLTDEVEYLETLRPSIGVDADVAKAQAKLKDTEKSLNDLKGARAEVTIDADTAPAEQAIGEFPGEAEKQGGKGGKVFLGAFLGGLAATPIVGAIVGLAQDIGRSFMSAFQVEVRSDRLMAQTGLDPVTVGRLARASGEAYANNWGESIAANMDTARQAVQAGLLDPESTARDSQNIIQSLAGVADVIGEDIARVTRTTTTLLRTGLAASADDAFDIIVKGQQAGLNVSEDWLDTLNEYSTKFRDLGLTAPQALGLMQQAVQAGARDTDKAADALKEFAIRGKDGTDATAEGFTLIGLNADVMREKIAAGGPVATQALGETLDALRAIEDPALRDAAAVALFGTQAEDLGAALFAMDLNTAADGFTNLAGTAGNALSVLTDNAANDMAEAQRNIEVAKEGILGALAQAFNPQIEEFASFVSDNRAAVMTFLLDIANGMFDFGRSAIEASASATEGFGSLVGTSGPLVLDMIGSVIDGYVAIAEVSDPFNIIGTRDAARQARDDFNEFKVGALDAFDQVETSSASAADAMRTNLIENGLDPAQAKLNEIAIPLVAQAAVHDATMAMFTDIDSLGYAADGSKESIDLLTTSTGDLYTSSVTVDEQIAAVVASMRDQAAAGVEAGDSQADLTARLGEGRDALILQLEQLGLSTAEANRLADAFGAVPEDVLTTVRAETSDAERKLRTIQGILNGMPDVVIGVDVGRSGYYANRARGSIDVSGGSPIPMGAGGIPGTALDPIAQMVPPGTLRIVGDRLDVDELYAPLDGSPRSWALLMEGLRRMPGTRPMAEGGLLSSSRGGGYGGDSYNVNVTIPARDVAEFNTVVAFFDTLRRQSRQAAGVRS